MRLFFDLRQDDETVVFLTYAGWTAMSLFLTWTHRTIFLKLFLDLIKPHTVILNLFQDLQTNILCLFLNISLEYRILNSWVNSLRSWPASGWHEVVLWPASGWRDGCFFDLRWMNSDVVILDLNPPYHLPETVSRLKPTSYCHSELVSGSPKCT